MVFELLVTNGTALCILIVKNNCDCRFGNTSLPLLIYKLLQITNAHLQNRCKCLTIKINCASYLAQICYTQHEAYGIKNVPLASAIKTRDSIKGGDRIPE